MKPHIAGRARHLAVVLLAYAGLAAAMHWPLVLHLGSHVAGPGMSDNFEALWHIAHAAKALFEAPATLLYEPAIYHPYGWHLASGAVPPWFAAALAPLTRLVGPVASLNLTYLGLLAVAGCGAYGMAHHLTRNRLAAFVAGAIYMTAPVLTLRLRGHVHLLAGAALLPFSFWAAAAALDSRVRKRQLWGAVATGSCLALSVLCHWYYVFVAVLPLTVFVLAYGMQRRRWRASLLVLATAAMIVLALAGPFALETAQARRAMHGEGGTFPLAESDQYSLSPDLLLAPNRFHPLLAPWAAHKFPLTGEQDVSSLGYAATLLAVIGLWKGRDERKWTLLIVSACALLLAMGTTLHWRGKRVEIAHNATVASLLSLDEFQPEGAAGTMPIPLPGLVLARIVPLYSAIRVWGRFSIPLLLMVSALASMGIACLSREGKRAWILTAICIMIIVAEGWVAPYVNPYTGDRELTDVGVNQRPSLLAWLAQQPDDAVLIEYPLGELDVLAMYSQSLHGLRLVNGYMSLPPRHLIERLPQLGTLPSADALAVLREWQVDYVIVSERAEAQIAPEAYAPGLAHVATFEDAFAGYVRTHVFAVDPDAP